MNVVRNLFELLGGPLWLFAVVVLWAVLATVWNFLTGNHWWND